MKNLNCVGIRELTLDELNQVNGGSFWRKTFTFKNFVRVNVGGLILLNEVFGGNSGSSSSSSVSSNKNGSSSSVSYDQFGIEE